MPNPKPFGLLNTKQGTFILNKNDYHMISETKGYGVGFQLMNNGEYEPEELKSTLGLINSRVNNFGPGAVVVDCGANIGIFTTAWAELLNTRGHVYAFEAQEKIFYALAGNVILHNCLNVTARFAAVGAEEGTLDIPEPDYTCPASFGSFELKRRDATEDIGQKVNYTAPTLRVPLITLDSLDLHRLDFLKIDVEGMELEVLQGALETIKRCQPQILVEVVKSDPAAISKMLTELGYNRQYPMGMNTLCLHDTDPVEVKTEEVVRA